MWKTIILLVCSTIFSFGECHTNPIVATQYGPIKGSLLTTVLGKTIFSFRGIRYAEAPLGALRFQPPVPIKKWHHLYDATKDGPLCPQPGIPPISEDCLFLNVYTTKLPNGYNHPKRPVIFYMHPGGFYSLTGNSQWAGPQYLLDHDVVLVTINYRLAALGLLSTGDCHAPGNNAFKDQIVAMKWVQDNIASFGGDPDLVTLLGYSAGALSITYHLVSPMSRGLFHRAAIMAASGYGKGRILSDQLGLAKQQARILGCPEDTSAKIVKCLKTKSAQEYADSFYKFQIEGFSQMSLWQIVDEPDCGQERFMVGDPSTIAECKHFQKVPVMAGVTYLELAGFAYYIIENSTLRRKLDTEFYRFAPILVNYESDTENSRHISRELRKFYLGEEPLTPSSAKGFGEIFADGHTGFQVNRAVNTIARHSNKPVYYYRFDFEGRYSFYYQPGTTIPYGVVHHDDLMYLFYIPALFPIFNQTDPEFHMMRKYTTMFSNFALTGNPTPRATELLDNVVWTPYSTGSKEYLLINKTMTMHTGGYFKKRYDLWDRLFPVPTCYHH